MVTDNQIKLYPHQQSGIAFAADRQAAFFNWGMGSGKTLAAIAAAKDSAVAIVVCPVSVGPSWARHFVQHDPGRIVVNCFSGTSIQRQNRLALAMGHVTAGRRVAILVNYDSVWRPRVAAAIERMPVGMIVLDESHRAKSPGGRASRYLFSLAKKHKEAKRLCLSGTPCPHSPLDLYGQYRFLAPEIFGTNFAAFRARYSVPHPRFPSQAVEFINQAELAEKISGVQHSVDSDAVLSLPDAVHTRIDVPLSRDETRFYMSMAEQLVAEVDGGEVTASNMLTKILRLQQACSGHTTLTLDNGTKQSVVLDAGAGMTSKGAALADWMADVPAKDPIVVFCLFKEDLRQAGLAADANNRPSYELSGSKNDLEVWQGKKDGGVIAVQISSGGVGVDLTRAAHCAFLSLGYSLGDYEQALARIRRPGQTKSVCRYYHFLAQVDGLKTTIDQLVYSALRDRREVVEGLMDAVRELVEKEGNQHGNQFADNRPDSGFDVTSPRRGRS